VTIPSSYVTTSHLTSLLTLLTHARPVVTYSLTKGMLAFPATGLKQSVKRPVRSVRNLRDSRVSAECTEISRGNAQNVLRIKRGSCYYTYCLRSSDVPGLKFLLNYELFKEVLSRIYIAEYTDNQQTFT